MSIKRSNDIDKTILPLSKESMMEFKIASCLLLGIILYSI